MKPVKRLHQVEADAPGMPSLGAITEEDLNQLPVLGYALSRTRSRASTLYAFSQY